MSDSNDRFAPGWPGISPRWTSSAKSGIGTALNPHSRVWYTVSHGILNEVYFPRVDQACTRDLGLIITDGELKLDFEDEIVADACITHEGRIVSRLLQGAST